MTTEPMKLRPQTRLARIESVRRITVRDGMEGEAPEMPEAGAADAAPAPSESDIAPSAVVVEFTFSSEEPYDRGWGTEILGHGFGE